MPPVPMGAPPHGFPPGFPGGRGGGPGAPPRTPTSPALDPLTEAFYKLRCPACQAFIGNHPSGQIHRCVATLYAMGVLKETQCPTCGKAGPLAHSTPETYACMDSYFIRRALDRTFLDLLDSLWKR